MRKNASEFLTNYTSEPGAFRVNYDYFSFVQLDNFACWIIADGINSELEKKSAEIAVRYLLNEFTLHPTISPRLIKKYLGNANRMLQIEGKELALSASILMVVSDYSKMIWAVVGNARLYYYSKGQMIFRSKDQSLTQMIFEAGKINESDLNIHNERNNLNNYLGIPGNFEPFVSEYYDLNDGDLLILCTVGYWEKLYNYEIVNVIRDTQVPTELIGKYQELLQKKQDDLLNNYTVAVIYVKKVFQENKKFLASNFKKISYTFLVGILIVGTGILINQFYHKKLGSIMEAKEVSTKIKNKDQTEIQNSLQQHQALGEEKFQGGDYEQALKEYQRGESLARELSSFEQESVLQKKVELVTEIIKANQFFEQREYQTALEIYQESEQAMAAIGTTNGDLKKRIERTEKCVKVIELVNAGDKAFKNENYDQAKPRYLEAKAIADKYSFNYTKKQLKSRLNKVKLQEEGVSSDSLALEIKDNKTIEDAKKIELEGDANYEDKDYRLAFRLYGEAKKIYEELNEIEALEKVEKKEEKAARKANSLFARLFEK